MVASVAGKAYESSMGGFILPGSVPVTEDKTTVGGSVGGCGEASLLAIVAPQIAHTATDPSALAKLIQWADNHGLTIQANGDSSPSELISMAKQYFGVTVKSATPSLSKLDSILKTNQVEIGVSNATAFGGWNSNVHGHYVTVVGKTQDGNYIVSDPNQPESENDEFIVYDGAQIMNAQPFWMGYAGNPPIGAPTIGGTSINLPSSLLNWLGLPPTVMNWITQPIRLLKLIGGAALILVAAFLFIVPAVAGPATEVAGVATGQPEVVAAGAAISSVTGHRAHTGVTVTTPARAPTTAPIQRAPATRKFRPPHVVPNQAPKRPAPVTRPLRAGKLGATPNPMTAQQVSQAQQKPAPRAAAITQPLAPTPRRGPKTGLRWPWGRRVMSREPIPREEHHRVMGLFKKVREDRQKQTDRTKARNEKYKSIDEILRDLRGGS